ncbi:hypothetical protein [Burkholderia sp. HI2500]|uniref:hypothetical protein n=1 Tax=Burkholderia sp. HI2500 TaxID=2015358 RepID=UPI00117D4A6B|nr:hypothetical protein [Burkholderia sp. HI2500]
MRDTESPVVRASCLQLKFDEPGLPVAIVVTRGEDKRSSYFLLVLFEKNLRANRIAMSSFFGIKIHLFEKARCDLYFGNLSSSGNS